MTYVIIGSVIISLLFFCGVFLIFKELRNVEKHLRKEIFRYQFAVWKAQQETALKFSKASSSLHQYRLQGLQKAMEKKDLVFEDTQMHYLFQIINISSNRRITSDDVLPRAITEFRQIKTNRINLLTDINYN